MIKKAEAKIIRVFHSVMYMIVWSVFYIWFLVSKLFFIKFIIKGKHNLPKKGRFILAANHQNFFDGFLISFLYNPLKVITPLIAKRALKHRFFELVARSMDAAILEEGIEAYQRALKKLNRVLTHGGVVIIFPEGNISNNSIPKKFKGGVAKLSIDSRTKIIPIHLSGTYTLRIFKNWFKNPKVLIKIGKPIELYSYANEYNNDLDKLASLLRDKIIELSQHELLTGPEAQLTINAPTNLYETNVS